MNTCCHKKKKGTRFRLMMHRASVALVDVAIRTYEANRRRCSVAAAEKRKAVSHGMPRRQSRGFLGDRELTLAITR